MTLSFSFSSLPSCEVCYPPIFLCQGILPRPHRLVFLRGQTKSEREKEREGEIEGEKKQKKRLSAMEQQPTMSWSEQLQENPLIAPGEDEFSNFLEFNMHFSDLEGHGPAQTQSQLQQQHALVPPTAIATTTAPEMSSDSQAHSFPSMEGLGMDFNPHGSFSQAQSQPQSHAHSGSIPYSTPSMTPGFCAQDTSQPSTSHSFMQGQQMIPPTPNSMELHGNAARYSHRDEHSEMYDRYSRISEEQV